MRPLHAVVVGAIGLVAVFAAGCGGAIPSSDGGPAVLKVSSSADGRYLVDGHGHSVYLFEKDDSGALGTIKRDDGDMQVTYHGHPLYYYAADASTPGKDKGEDIEQFGAGWYLVGARGEPFEPESGSGSGSNSGSNTGGGGYG